MTRTYLLLSFILLYSFCNAQSNETKIRKINTISDVVRYEFYKGQLIISHSNGQNSIVNKPLNYWFTENDFLLEKGINIYHMKKKKWLFKDEANYYPVLIHDDKLLCRKADEDNIYYRFFDLKKKSYSIERFQFLGVPVLSISNMIITRDKNIIRGYENSIKIWELDVSALCSFNVGDGLESAQVNNLYNDESTLFVLAGLSVLALDPHIGSIRWHTQLETWQSRAVLSDSLIYTTSNAYLNRINKSTGEIDFEVHFDYVTVDKEVTLGPIMELAEYNGSVWSIMDSNPGALIEFNSIDGTYKSIYSLRSLGLFGDCHMAKFNANNIYIRDFNRVLHVFQVGE